MTQFPHEPLLGEQCVCVLTPNAHTCSGAPDTRTVPHAIATLHKAREIGTYAHGPQPLHVYSTETHTHTGPHIYP